MEKIVKTSRVNQQRPVIFLLVGVSLLLCYFLINFDGAIKTAEILEAKLDEEKEILKKVCSDMTNLDNKINAGGMTYLGDKLITLEELVLSVKLHSCSAADKTIVILDKIIKLEHIETYKSCISHQTNCDKLIPALQEIEVHLDARLSNIEELKTVYKLMSELVPSSTESSKKFNEASSIINNFYICLEFVFMNQPVE